MPEDATDPTNAATDVPDEGAHAPGRTVARAVLEQLAAQGVTVAFGLPGVHNLAFWQAEGPDLPRIVGVRHEQTAGYAADGLARATGGLGVALVTSGPGAANVVTAAGEATVSRSPILVIASEPPLARRVPGVTRGLLHELADQSALFAGVTVFAASAEPPTGPEFSHLAHGRPAPGWPTLPWSLPAAAERAVALVREAVAAALSGARGAAYVGIPSDVLEHAYDGPPAEPVVLRAPQPSAGDVATMAALIDAAPRVVVWAGGGAVDADTELRAFAARAGAPIVTTFAGRGLAAGSPWLIGAPPQEPDVARVIGDADLLLAVGTDLDGMNTRNGATPMPPSVLSISTDSTVLARNVALEHELGCDAAIGLAAVTERLRRAPRTPWVATADLAADLRARVRADPATADGLDLVDAIDSSWPSDGVVACDMAVAGYWVGGYGRRSRPRGLLYPVGWGTLGIGLPAAIGAATAGIPTLAVVGDGGVMFALGELATLVQEQLPLTLLVVDDGGYGMLRYDQQVAGHAERGVDLVTPDWLALAASFGLDAVQAHDPGEGLRATLAACAMSARAGLPRMVLLRAALVPPRTTSPRWHEG